MSATVHDLSNRTGSLLGRLPGVGSLSYCSTCARFGLRYGSVHLRLTRQGLLDLFELIDSLLRHVRDEYPPASPIWIAIDGSTVSLGVAADQLSSLRELVGYGAQLALADAAGAARREWRH